MALTYGKYLHLDKLLDAQHPLSEGPEHDEMLFIVIHQVYELWFKQILHEATRLGGALEGGDTHQVLATLKRVLTILKTLVGQIDILETMTPISFNSFRERLDTASGFESAQFRAFEFTLGHKRTRALTHYPEGSGERRMLQLCLESPTLWDQFLRYLAHQDYEIPDDLLQRNFAEPTQASEEVQAVLLRVYHEDPLLALVCEHLVDLDEGIQEWRYRHVKMIERTIGSKGGSGGSSGAEYLKSTLFRPVFPDLWAIRVHF